MIEGQSRPKKWILRGNYIVDTGRSYDKLGIAELLRAKTYYCMDPSNPDLDYLCIEFSIEMLTELVSRPNDIVLRYENQKCNGEMESQNNNLLEVHKVLPNFGPDGSICVFTESVKDTSIKKQLAEGKKFSTEEALKIFAQLYNALKQLAKSGVTPVQIHPGFILFDLQDNIKLSPICYLINTDPNIRCYINPDEASGRIESGIAPMIWNAGVIYYELLTGTLPWSMSEMEGGYAPPVENTKIDELGGEFSEDCKQILKVMLRVDEFQHMESEELVRRVEKYINDNYKPLTLSATEKDQQTKQMTMERRQHRDYKCAVCGKSDFIGPRFSAEDDSLCSRCFRSLGRGTVERTELKNKLFLKIDRPYFPRDPIYNNAVHLYTFAKKFIQEAGIFDSYSRTCTICSDSHKIYELYRLRDNPFVSCCEKDSKNNFGQYLNERDSAEEWNVLYWDLNCNAPIFHEREFQLSKRICSYIDGEIYDAKKIVSHENISGNRKHFNFLENLTQASIIKLNRNQSSSGAVIKHDYQSKVHSKLSSFYADNLLRYCSIDVDENNIILLIEPLGADWRSLQDYMNSRMPSSLEEIRTLMIKVCECVESLHDMGIPHCLLSPDVFLVLGDIMTPDFEIKLGGLELSDLRKYLKVDPIIRTKKYRDLASPMGIENDIYALGKILKDIEESNNELWKGVSQITKQILKNLYADCSHRIPMFRPSAEEIIKQLANLTFIQNNGLDEQMVIQEQARPKKKPTILD